MTKKKIAKAILDNTHDFDEIVYALQDTKQGQAVLDKCNYDFDKLIYWAQTNIKKVQER